MYVCNCNGIRERDVRGALKAGVETVSGLYRHCGQRPQCGKCTPVMVDMLREHIRETDRPEMVCAAAD